MSRRETLTPEQVRHHVERLTPGLRRQGHPAALELCGLLEGLLGTVEAQAAELERLRGEAERLQRQVIQERHDERTAIQAQIDALVTELEGVDAQKDWALARSLDNLIDALMAKKDVLHRIADWQAIAQQDRRRAALVRPAAAEAGAEGGEG